MHVDLFASTAMFAVFIWALAFMLPRAVKSREPLAVTSAVLTAVLSLVGWLMIGVRAGSTQFPVSVIAARACPPASPAAGPPVAARRERAALILCRTRGRLAGCQDDNRQAH
jgi:hypothetical protein